MGSSSEEVLRILPAWMREDVNRYEMDRLKEIRLRLNSFPELIQADGRVYLKQRISRSDLSFCIHAASSYSPWASTTMAEGFLTAPGGHRIGICGEMYLKDGIPSGFREISSLCIRIAADIKGIAAKAADLKGSILILGAPGWGKTTLLRDLIRFRSHKEPIAVVDERGELFPPGFEQGLQTDVLTGCPKNQGVLQVLRTMSPGTIAMDEITDRKDCEALEQCFHCGVSLLATVHAESLEDFKQREHYKTLLRSGIFSYVLSLQKDQTYQVERMEE